LGLVHGNRSTMFHIGDRLFRLSEYDIVCHDESRRQLLGFGQLATVHNELPGVRGAVGESRERGCDDGVEPSEASRIENVAVRRRVGLAHRIQVLAAEAGLTTVGRRKMKHCAVVHYHAIASDRTCGSVRRLDGSTCPIVDEACADVGRRRTNVDRCHHGSNDVSHERRVDGCFQRIACRRETTEMPDIIEDSALRAGSRNRTVVNHLGDE